MADAFRLLRQHGDAAAAATRLDAYLAQHAAGPLMEEALALRIEAAHRLGDDSDAARVAAAYLTRFPTGRFHALAAAAVEARSHERFGGPEGIR